jgi:hypothetical protein
MQIYAFDIRFLFSSLSLRIPPKSEEVNPRTDKIKAFINEN